MMSLKDILGNRHEPPQPFDPGALLDEAMAARRRADERTGRIAGEVTRYQREQLNRGGTAATEPPDEAREAAAKVQSDLRATLARIWAKAESHMLQDARQRFAERAAQYESLAAGMDLDRQRAAAFSALASACGAVPPARITDEHVTQFGFEDWRRRIERALNPPKVQPVADRPPNVLNIEG